jgi:glutamate synthase domain-containing protein 3
VKDQVLDKFIDWHHLAGVPRTAVEDEFVYQNTYRLNQKYYSSLGEQRAFVLSHAKNLSVLKVVGYVEDVITYYKLDDQAAHVWIAHQRYPTKGRVWHPGGAHPFVGLNEALVHNGDFANYHAVCEYLQQRNVDQLFLTDTEVSVQLFDLWDRVYGYPLEITLEAMAPTTDYDFTMLPAEKQRLYRAVQHTHIHASPDGPWFFILARSKPGKDHDRFELLGITDTSMLRPQVFALYDNCGPDQDPASAVQIGLIASERQAVNACLRSLSEEDSRFQPLADKYWVARGGSYTDGGSFLFTVSKEITGGHSAASLQCVDKFGSALEICSDKMHIDKSEIEPCRVGPEYETLWRDNAYRAFDDGGAPTLWKWLKANLQRMNWEEFAWGLNWLGQFGSKGDSEWMFVFDLLNLVRDLPYHPGSKRRASLDALVDAAQNAFFLEVPYLEGLVDETVLRKIRRIDWKRRHVLRSPIDGQSTLIIDSLGFPAEGEESAARWMVTAVHQGWKRLIVSNWRGGRFAGSGLGATDNNLRIDLYGDVGDYAGSGLDGVEMYIHGSGQDQVGQILKRGKLVLFGDAGQTFLYGAKGGSIFVLGSVAGRPLINAVGKPKAVINGTCLDYLAESFMAGDPLNGGGFVIINGVTHDENGNLVELPTPYPGGNLMSLASGGAIYIRDPKNRIGSDQLNGGQIFVIDDQDWVLINKFLVENERLFGIQIEDLLKVNGDPRTPQEVYKKITPQDSRLLSDA